MGCGGSKECPSKEIKYEMDNTKVGSFDSLFETASNILKNAESIRAGIEDSIDTSIEITGLGILKPPNTAKFADVFSVMLWSVASNNKGSLDGFEIKLTKESPYIDC